VTEPTTHPRIAVTMRWDELTVQQRLAVAETANALAAGSLDLDSLRAFLNSRYEPTAPDAVKLFAVTVRRIVDALHAYECETVDDLRAAVDVAPYCDRLENVIADSLQAVTDVDTALDDAMVVGLAAQIVADAVAAQNRADR